jgi:hypothetical protein
MNYLPRLTSNLDPPNLSLPSSYGLQVCEPPATSWKYLFWLMVAEVLVHGQLALLCLDL